MTTTTTHTPGPWTDDGGNNPLISGADGKYIAQVLCYSDCDVGSLRPEAAADIALICAAPDLLAALKEAVEEMRIVRKSILRYAPNSMVLSTSIEIGLAAIAKAEVK